MMSVRTFRDDDAGYLALLDGHPDGYVVNIARSYRAAEARVHRVGCSTISGQSLRGRVSTAEYVKVCADQLAALEQWATDAVGQSIPSCGMCGQTAEGARGAAIAGTAPAPEGRFQVHGPVQLEPSDGQVLHAVFFGVKRSNADVENLGLYNIDSFRVAGRTGIRFELGGPTPAGPEGSEYPFCYRYALTPRSGTFAHWRPRRTLASFNWTDLGEFVGQKQAVQVWWALTRSRIDVAAPARASEAPFAVKIELRPPRGGERVLGGVSRESSTGDLRVAGPHRHESAA